MTNSEVLNVGDEVDVIESNGTTSATRVKITHATKTQVRVNGRKFRRVPSKGRLEHGRWGGRSYRTDIKPAGAEIGGSGRVVLSDVCEANQHCLTLSQASAILARTQRHPSASLEQLREMVALIEPAIRIAQSILADESPE